MKGTAFLRLFMRGLRPVKGTRFLGNVIPVTG